MEYKIQNIVENVVHVLGIWKAQTGAVYTFCFKGV